MIKFILKYIGVMLVVMLLISAGGYFAGRAIQAQLPDDGIDVYPSYQAAVAAANRGNHIANQFEAALVILSGTIIFVVMYRRHKARAAAGEHAGSPAGS
jgi:hypothetical protein